MPTSSSPAKKSPNLFLLGLLLILLIEMIVQLGAWCLGQINP